MVFGTDGSTAVYVGSVLMTMAVTAIYVGTPHVLFKRASTGAEERTLDEEMRAVTAAGFRFTQD